MTPAEPADWASALTRFLHDVGHSAGAVFAVLEGDLRLAGPLHRDAEPPGARLSGPDAELGCTHTHTHTRHRYVTVTA